MNPRRQKSIEWSGRHRQVLLYRTINRGNMYLDLRKKDEKISIEQLLMFKKKWGYHLLPCLPQVDYHPIHSYLILSLIIIRLPIGCVISIRNTWLLSPQKIITYYLPRPQVIKIKRPGKFILTWNMSHLLLKLPMKTLFSIENTHIHNELHIGGLVQDCSISIANALEKLQSSTKLWIYTTHI